MEPAAPESAFFLTMLVKSAYDVELWVLSQWQMADTDSTAGINGLAGPVCF